MTEYLTEQEQIEILKSWIKQYSLVILAGVMIAIISMSAWRFWDQRQTKILDHASSVYDEMLTMRAQNQLSETEVQNKKLFSHYEQTIYGKMAGLMFARTDVVKNNYSDAEKQLQWVIDHAKVDAFKEIARIRLARLLIAEKNPQAALNMLNTVNDKNFGGLINEVRGDAYLAENKPNDARAAYQLAISQLPNADVIRPLLQMKYDNLSTSTPS